MRRRTLIIGVFALLTIRVAATDPTDTDRRLMVEIARAVKRVKRNPFLRDDPAQERSSKDSDLREKEEDEVESSKSDLFHGSSTDYCDKFEQHFSFYCIGEVDQSGKNDYVLKKFCPAYKSACSHKTIASSVSLTSWPSDPFEKRISVTSSPGLERFSSTRNSHSRYTSDESTDEDDEGIYYTELKRRYPCKPDCDRRIFAHCTEECKCDYIYPIVQRFCNPPPMPLFLNTCRLWYHGCPKYERYHYASQFVYSKADKGKVLPGTPDVSQVNPYNIPQPVPLRNRALALAPIRRQKRETSDDDETLELVVPPPIPKPTKFADLRSVSINEDREIPLSAPQSRAILLKYRSSMEEKRRGNNEKRRRKVRRHRRRRYQYEIATTTRRPPTPKEVWRTLKALNGLTSGDSAIGLTQSPATLRGTGQRKGGLDAFLEYVNEQQPQKQKDQGLTDWASVASDPREFTKEIVSTVVRGEDLKDQKEDAVDFSKIRPRTLSSGPSSQVAESGERSEETGSSGKAKAYQGSIPVLSSDSAAAARSGGDDTFAAFDGLSDSRGIVHSKHSRSPFTKPGLWEPNPADPHSRDPANKFWYHPESVGVDWLNGQLQWGAHWAVPAAGTGGTDGMSAVHFPSIGSFLNIPDDYD